MTAQEVKDYIVAQLVVPVNLVSKVINSLNKIVDYVTTSNPADVIPDWTSALTFNTDGTADGRYCNYPDTNSKKRIFQTKTDGNINHPPPTNPAITEDTYWIEVSPSASAPIPEWSPGVYGTGLIIVYHNHSVDGRGLYVLLEAVRPYTSANIETETTALKWERMGGSGSGKGVAKTYTDIAGLLADQAAQKQDFFYLVTDASSDATVDAGWALYQKLAASTAAIGDYRKLNEAESLDVIIASTPNWDATTPGKVERSTTAEAQNIVTRVAAGSSNSSNDDGRTPSEKGLVEMLLSFLGASLTWGALQIYTTGIRLVNTTANQFLRTDGSKNVVSVGAAAVSDINLGTNDTLPITSLGLQGSKYESQYGLRTFVNGTSGTNTYTGVLAPAITTYGSGGLNISVKFTNANTGPSTLNLSSLGALTMLRYDGAALVKGDIPAGSTKRLIYDGTNLIMLNPSISGVADYAEKAPAFSSPNFTIDCALQVISNHAYATLSGNATIGLTQDDNAKLIGLVMAVTGTGIVLTFPSTFRMDKSVEGSVWNQSTKALTISSSGVGDLHEFSFRKSGSIWIIRYSGPIRP